MPSTSTVGPNNLLITPVVSVVSENQNNKVAIRNIPLTNSQEFIILQPLCNCCFNVKMHMNFSLRRYNYVEIAKIRKISTPNITKYP